MEKYYEVTEAHSLHGDYFKWRENEKETREVVEEFFKAHEIEAVEYAVDNRSIFIVPTEADIEKFGNTLSPNQGQGLYKFKGNSKVHNAWIKFLKFKAFSIIDRPRTIFYIRANGGRYRSRLFDQNGKLYTSFDPAPETTPEGFIEMKASEFHKIIEEDEVA